MTKPQNAVNQLFNNPSLRSILLKARIPLSILAGALLLTQIDRAWFWPGICVAALGSLFQLWCFSCINTHRELARNGPYMYIRNPMYVARFILFLGFILLTGNLVLVGLYTVLYAYYMVNRVEREEEKLREIFGAPYAEYCATVPRFFPNFRPYPGGGRLLFFSWEFFQRQHGVTNALVVLGAFAVCWFATFVLRA